MATPNIQSTQQQNSGLGQIDLNRYNDMFVNTKANQMGSNGAPVTGSASLGNLVPVNPNYTMGNNLLNPLDQYEGLGNYSMNNNTQTPGTIDTNHYLTKQGAASGATPYNSPTTPPPPEQGNGFGLAEAGLGVQALTGLGQLYYANKNYKLQKEHQDYLKGREAKNDARLSKFAARVGGDY